MKLVTALTLTLVTLVATTASAFNPGAPKFASTRAFAAELTPTIQRAAKTFAAAQASSEAFEKAIVALERALLLSGPREVSAAAAEAHVLGQRTYDLVSQARAAQLAMEDVDHRLHKAKTTLGDPAFEGKATHEQISEAIDLGDLELAMIEDPGYNAVEVGAMGLLLEAGCRFQRLKRALEAAGPEHARFRELLRIGG